MLAEVVRKEEVTVFLVVGSVQFVGGGLCAAFRRDAFCGGFLLRDYRLELQFSELHVRANTKQTGGTFHQRVV